MYGHVCVKMAHADLGQVPNSLSLQWEAWKLGVFCLSIISFGLVKFVEFVVN